MLPLFIFFIIPKSWFSWIQKNISLTSESRINNQKTKWLARENWYWKHKPPTPKLAGCYIYDISNINHYQFPRFLMNVRFKDAWHQLFVWAYIAVMLQVQFTVTLYTLFSIFLYPFIYSFFWAGPSAICGE